jgi:small subunit ribosomal protein S20
LPNHKSAEKRVRTAEKSRLKNKAARSEFRTSLKKFRAATTSAAAKTEMAVLFKLLDKAARKSAGGITTNAASNYKRKAHLFINTLIAAGK